MEKAENTVTVTVQYVGNEDYVDGVRGNPPLGQVKRAAMGKFELEPGAADEYALQLDGANVDETRHVRDLDTDSVTLVLVRTLDLTKG